MFNKKKRPELISEIRPSLRITIRGGTVSGLSRETQGDASITRYEHNIGIDSVFVQGHIFRSAMQKCISRKGRTILLLIALEIL